MDRPEIYECNGYQLIKGGDFKWRICTDDGPVGKPYDLFTEAQRAAESLPPNRPIP